MSLEKRRIIQGGMGVGISSFSLARAVSLYGELGVVSGTGVSVTVARRLQDGDKDYLRAIENFPDPEISQEVISRYYLPNGRADGQRYKPVPMAPAAGYTITGQRLNVVANFAEVFLAKEGHDQPIGVNYLEKLQRPHLSSLYGAMLAGADLVIMGAGIPTQIPGVLDTLSRHQRATYRLDVEGALPDDNFHYDFDPQTFSKYCQERSLIRPDFFAIISSHILAQVMTSPKKVSGKVNGFIVEGPTAGGHNAPPRSKQISEQGEAIYTDRDKVDFDKLRSICQSNNIPFYMAGSYASPEGFAAALELGASGIQVGSAFALSEESGMRPDIRSNIRRKAREGRINIKTDAYASPSGYPFKVAELDDTLSQDEVYEARPRLCDVGKLQTLYRKDDGTIGARCPAEEIKFYLQKGGKIEDTYHRKCICNGLIATNGLPQIQPAKRGYVEQAIVTLGDDLSFLYHLPEPYFALDVIHYILGDNQ